MRLRYLGWAGVELEAEDGATVVVDALTDPAAVFAALGGDAADAPLPEVVPPAPGRAVAGLVTHLHRDHADARALQQALALGACVYEPPAGSGEGLEEIALAQAQHELDASGLERRRVQAWASAAASPFTFTALPAVDGTGDPQVSWLVEAGGVRVLHLGDTMFHGYWWRMALRHGPFDVVLVPVNGAVLGFPHRQPASPLPAVLDPQQAAIAAQLLRARVAIPIHFEGYEVGGVYEPVAGAAERFVDAADGRGVETRPLATGESLELVAAAAAPA